MSMGDNLFAQISTGFYVAGFVCVLLSLAAIVYLLRRRAAGQIAISVPRAISGADHHNHT